MSFLLQDAREVISAESFLYEKAPLIVKPGRRSFNES